MFYPQRNICITCNIFFSHTPLQPAFPLLQYPKLYIIFYYIIYNFEHTTDNKNVTHSVCVKNMIHMLQVLRFPCHS